MVTKFNSMEHFLVCKKAMSYMESLDDYSKETPEYVKVVVRGLEELFAPYSHVPQEERNWFDKNIVSPLRYWLSQTPSELSVLDLREISEKIIGMLCLLRNELMSCLKGEAFHAERMGLK